MTIWATGSISWSFQYSIRDWCEGNAKMRL